MSFRRLHPAQRYVGETLIVISGVHMVYGIMDYVNAVKSTFDYGWWNQFAAQVGHADAESMWFMTLGPGMFLLGWMARHSLRTTGTLPLMFGALMIATSIVSLVVMPQNGMWLVLVCGGVAVSITLQHSEFSESNRQSA